METLSFSLYFSFHAVFSVTATLEKPLRTSRYCMLHWGYLDMLDHTLRNISLNIFPFLAVCECKDQCDPVILSGGKCDQRILQSNWMKTLPGTTQEQKFFQIWDLYSKTGFSK